MDSRIALITGAANGIGRGIANVFAQAGCKLSLLDTNAASLEHTADELRESGAELETFTCDVRSQDQVQQAVDATVARFGRLDVAVSNAGVYPNTAVVDMDETEWDLVIETNLKGSFLVSRAARRSFRPRLDRRAMSRRTWRAALITGTVGYLGRAALFATVGACILRASAENDPQSGQGVDGSIRILADSSAGPVLLWLLAIPLATYGGYMGIESRYRHV